MNWINFDPAKGYEQPLPPERKLVVVQSEGRPGRGMPPSVSVGYLRFAAGEKDSPFFVVPGVERGPDVAWCDCLPEGFGAPLWSGYPHTAVAQEPAAWVNSDELDNMLEDRTATVQGTRSGWRGTPLYRDRTLGVAPSVEPEPSEAQLVCYEAYQVVGSLLSDLGKFDTPEAEKILDNLSQAKLVHKDVLPWESYATAGVTIPDGGQHG